MQNFVMQYLLIGFCLLSGSLAAAAGVAARQLALSSEQRLAELRNELEQRDFSYVAAEHSIVSAKEDGGDLGEFELSGAQVEVAQALRSLPIGGLSQPLTRGEMVVLFQRLAPPSSLPKVSFSYLFADGEQPLRELLALLTGRKIGFDAALARADGVTLHRGNAVEVNFSDLDPFLRLALQSLTKSTCSKIVRSRGRYFLLRLD